MEWLIPIGIAVLIFVSFSGPQECIKLFTDAGVKKAEANARAEEARTERAKLELERAQFEHNKTLT